MADDCDEFQHFCHRKGMLNHFSQMLEFQNNLYKGKWPERCCLNTLRVLSKLDKTVGGSQEKIEEIKKEFEEHKQTEDYKKWEKEHEANEDVDIVRNDPDPDGWKNFIKTCENPIDVTLDLVSKVGPANPQSADLQVKCLKFFIKADKGDLALQMAQNLIKHQPTHPKTVRGMQMFSEYAT